MTSATERLRALLDERGVEHYDGTECTLWGYEDYNEFTGIYRFSADETSEGHMQVRLWHATPEQAVAATLGETPTPHVEDLGRLHDELRDAIVEILGNRCDWDQTGVRHAHEVLERAATLGRGTCREVKIDRYWRGCGECGYVWEFMYGIGKCERPRYCPNCGRMVEE